jgi:hypothetical protein
MKKCSESDNDSNDFQSHNNSGASLVNSVASLSLKGNYTFLLEQTNMSSNKTVRVGPGYSILALPKPSQSAATASGSTSTQAESARRIVPCFQRNDETSNVPENHEMLRRTYARVLAGHTDNRMHVPSGSEPSVPLEVSSALDQRGNT